MSGKSGTAINVENPGKLYPIGRRGLRDLRESLDNIVSIPFRALHSANKRQKSSCDTQQNGKSFWAQKDVSSEVKHIETVGIITRNGSDKSTFLKIFSHIAVLTEGYAEIRKRVDSLLGLGTVKPRLVWFTEYMD